MKKRPPIKTIFGKIAMFRLFCEKCGGYALIVQGKYSCCGTAVQAEEEQRYRIKRESEGSLNRHKPPGKLQTRILEAQNHQCIYCGSPLTRGNAVWDHFVCFVYSRNNDGTNMVAACSKCNLIKGALMFNSIEEARIHVCQRRIEKGLHISNYHGEEPGLANWSMPIIEKEAT